MKRYLILALLIVVTSCKTENEDKNTSHDGESKSLIITGKANNPNSLSGDINMMGYFVESGVAGKLSINGDFNIELPENYDAITASAFETYNSSPAAEYNLEFSNALDSFPNANELDFTGKEEQIAYAGKFFRFEILNTAQTHFIYPSSSKTFLNHVVGKKNAIPEVGYHYYYIYSKGPVSIIGDRFTENLFEDGTNEIYSRIDSYQLEIKEGWNLIKYEISSITESSTGTIEITETAVTNEDIKTTTLSWYVE